MKLHIERRFCGKGAIEVSVHYGDYYSTEYFESGSVTLFHPDHCKDPEGASMEYMQKLGLLVFLSIHTHHLLIFLPPTFLGLFMPHLA